MTFPQAVCLWEYYITLITYTFKIGMLTAKRADTCTWRTLPGGRCQVQVPWSAGDLNQRKSALFCLRRLFCKEMYSLPYFFVMKVP